MDVSNYPPDMCPLCRQRALALDGTTLDCTSCHAKAEFDGGTRRIRYTSVPKRFEQFEAALQDTWLSRAEAFEATELKPLPAVVFFPVIVSLLALCALFGLIGVVLAVRPSAGTTREIIEDAYARQFGLQNGSNGSNGSLNSPPLTVTVELTTTVEVTVTGEALSPDAAGTATALASANPNLPPATEIPTANLPPTAELPTQQPTPLPPNIPTPLPLPPTFTPAPVEQPTLVPPTPVQPQPLPTGVLQSPIQPPSTATPTATPTTQGAATSTSTAASAPNQLGPVIVTGSVAITNVNAAAGSAFDEYLDIRNTSATPVTLVDWKLRVGGQVYNLSNPPGTQLQLLGLQGCRIYSGTNVGTVAMPPEYTACGAKFLGITSGVKIYPNTTGYQIELLNESNVVVAYFGR